MKPHPNKPASPRRGKSPGKLRRDAEARVGEATAAVSGQKPEAGPEAENQRLVQELQIHQVELQQQNEELRRLQAALEASAAHYTELYDFAPVGYFTLDSGGVISQANLAGERLLGCERGRLPGRRFGIYVAKADDAAFKAFLAQAFRGGATLPACDLELASEGQPPRVAHFTATLAPGGQECYLVALDITERRGVQEALREREQILSNILGQAVDAITLLDSRTGRFVEFNPAAHEPLGYTREEFAALTVADIEVWHSPEQIQENLEVMRQQGYIVFETQHRCRDGQVRDVRVSGSALHLEGRDCMVVLWSDITERKQTEAKLRAREAHYRLLAEYAGDVVWLYDLRAQRFTCVSPSIERLLGYTEAELLQMSMSEALVPEDYEAVAANLPIRIAAFMAGDNSVRTVIREIWQLRRDGTKVATEVVSTLIADERGQVTQMQGVTRDISERKRAEDRLRQSEAHYRLLAENSSDVIWVIDLGTQRLSYVSPSVERLRGYTVAEVMQQTLAEMMTPESYQMVLEKLPIRLAAFAAGDDSVRSQTHVVWQWCCDGSAVPTEIVTTLLADEHRQVTQILGVSRDITERKEAEERSQRLRDLGFVVAATADLSTALRLCLDAAIRISGMDAGGIYLAEELSGDLRLECHSGLSADFIAAVSRLPSDSENVRWARRSRPFHGNVRRLNLPGPTAEMREGLQALSLMPLYHDGHLIGILNVASHTVAEVSPTARDALETVASLVGSIIERLRAQQALRESDDLQRAILDNIPDPAWVKDAAGRFLRVNQAWLDHFDRTRDEVIGKTMADFVPSEVAKVQAERDAAAMAAGKPVTMEEEVPNSLGRNEWFDTSKVPFYTADGIVQGTIGIARNITERRRVELELRRTANLLQETQQTAQVGYYINTLSTGHWESSPVLDEIFGIDADFPRDLPGWGRLIHPEDQAAALRHFDQVIHGDGKFRLDYRIIHPSDGQVRWVAGYGQFEHAPDGKPVRLVGCIQDITERKAAELALRENELQLREVEASTRKNNELLRSIMESPQGVIIFAMDLQYRYTAFTVSHREAMRALWGAEIQLGMSVLEIISNPEDREKARQNFDRALRGENFILHEDYGDEDLLRGSWENRYAPIYDQLQTPVGLAVFVTDVSARKQAELALKQLNAELEQRVRERTAEALDLYHHAPCGYHSLGPDGVVLQMNDTELGWLGYSRDEVVGRLRLSDLMVPASAESFNEHFGKFKEHHIPVTAEWDLRCKDGSTITLLVNAAALLDESGRFQSSRATVMNITERKRAEEQLISIMKAVESTSDAVGISDAQARHFYQNRAFSELFGYATAEELQAAGGGPAIIKDPEVAREMFANIQSGKPWTGELEMVTRSGHVFPAYERAHPIKDEAGNLIGLVGIITDFSARKRDEDALRLFKNLVQHSSDAIGMSTPEGKHYYQNSAFDLLFGEVGNRRPESVFVDPAFGRQVFDTIMGGGSWQGEVQMFKHDGTILTTFQRAYAIKDQAGRVLSLVGLHTDITERRQAEENVRRSEERLKEAQRIARLGYLDWDLKTNALVLSEEALVIYHLDRNQPMHTLEEIVSLVHPEDRARVDQSLAATVAGISKHDMEHRMVCSDGEIIMIRATAELLRDADGNAARILGTIFDITEQWQAEQALRESEAKYRLLFDSAGDPIFIHDMAGRILAANRCGQAQLGYTLEELLSMTVAQLDSPEERQQVPQRIEKLLEKGHLNFETVQQRKDGSLFPIEASVQQIVWEGKPAILSITRDLTERRQAEAQLRKLQSVVEQTPVVVVITDSQGVIEYVNPSFVSQTGYTLAEMIGQKPSVIKSGLTSAEVYAELWRTLMAGQTWRGELCNRRKDGSLFWEIAVIAPLRDSAGRLTHFVAVKEDITERRRIAEELRLAKESADAANRAKSTFLANMSHEIRTPMNAILGFAQLMRRDAGLTPSQRQRLDTINRSGEHLIRLISDILDMAKIESGQMQLVLENCDFLVLLADVEAIFRSRIEERRLRFQVQHAPNLPSHLYTDGGKVRQVIYNVLGNAVKFTVQGGIRVRVSAEPAPPTDEGQQTARVCIEMTDTGPGIAEEESDQVFVAFEQTQSGRRLGGGSGLGLAISQRLARKLGGDLTFSSRVGVGSTFQFTFVAVVKDSLSVGTVPVIPARRVIGLQGDGPPPTVLVADDTESNRELLQNLLELVGFNVIGVEDGAAAVAQCRAYRPSLVLMDLRMPGLNGLDSIRAIRSAPGGQDTRILIVSADVVNISEEEWRGAGADGFVSKPFRNEQMLLQIGELLKVEYVFSEPPVATASLPGLSSEAVAQLSAALRLELIRATETGNGTRLRELINSGVAPAQPVLAQALGRLAAQYDYHTLLHFLKEEE